MRNRTHLALLGSLSFSLGLAANSHAAVYSYVDWEQADPALGTASGTITLPDDSTVTVTFEAVNSDGTPGNFYSAQTEGGTNYWEPSAPYISAEVENAPPLPDLLQLQGGDDQVYRVGLSEPIKDPVMALVSLGAPGTAITYDFDSPFTIVSQGAGYWGGSDTALEQQDGDVLWGEEGHGTIQFIGTFDSFSWTTPLPEFWHGFTFAIRTTERLEPTPPDAGVGEGWGDAGAAGDAGASLGDAGAWSPDAGDAEATDAGASLDASSDDGTSEAGADDDATEDDAAEDDATEDDATEDDSQEDEPSGADDAAEDEGASEGDAGEVDDGSDDGADAGDEPFDSDDDADDDDGEADVTCTCRTVGREAPAPSGALLLGLGMFAAFALRRRSR